MRISDWSSDVCSSDLWPWDVSGTWDRERQVSHGRVTCPCALLRCNGTLRSPPRYRPRPAMTARRARRSVDALPQRTAMTSHADPPQPPATAAVRRTDPSREPGYDARLSQHDRSEEHTSELQSLMRISYAVFCLKKTKKKHQTLADN